MSPEERKNHCYLGDGVYVEHTPCHIILRTSDHRDSHCDNKIYLDDSAISSLMNFLEFMKDGQI